MSRWTVECCCNLNTFVGFYVWFCRCVKLGTFVVSRRSGRSGFVGFWFPSCVGSASRGQFLAGSGWRLAKLFRLINGSGFSIGWGHWKSSSVPTSDLPRPRHLLSLCITSPITHALEQNSCQLHPRFPSWRYSCGCSFPPPAFVSAREPPSVISSAIVNPISWRVHRF